MTNPKQLLHRLRLIRQASAVKRFHILRTLNEQTVGAHSHGVAMLIMQIEPTCSATLLKAALTHDLHERDTGDMPSTAKWKYPKLAEAMTEAEMHWNTSRGFNFELSREERNILQFCDYFELMLWSYEELCMGNRYAVEPLVNIVKVLDLFRAPTEQAEQLYAAARFSAVEFLDREHEYAI